MRLRFEFDEHRFRVVEAAEGGKRFARWALFLAIALAPIAGLFLAPNIDAAAGYTLLTLSSVLPCALWIRSGMTGIPVWPAMSVMTWLYYAVPIIRDHRSESIYTPREILVSAMTVAAYMSMATLFSAIVAARIRRPASKGSSLAVSVSQLTAIIFLGLGLSAAFYIALIAGLLTFLGTFFGIARTIAGVFGLISCYMLGNAWGHRLIRGKELGLAFTVVAVNVLLAWSSLFLVGGMTYLLALVSSYVITTRRVPWVPLILSTFALTVLHAGKADMRNRYWMANTNSSDVLSLESVPNLLSDWFSTGMTDLTTGEDNRLIFDRASLFGLLLNVQQLAPENVPFLSGETYAFLPNMLVPRFLSPEKITSQEGMTLLNIHFGFQTYQDTRRTAIGWGLIAEGYANFGYMGVLGIGIVTGILAGIFMRVSSGAAPISSGALLGIVGLVTLVNLEADFSNLLTNLFQACISVLLISTALEWLGVRERRNAARYRQHLFQMGQHPSVRNSA